ncbi:MAG: hypothetical protein LAT80_14245 [Balneolaceae bacterium]|nr:hypothetical protein [Balneolaceae bacterium]
MITLKIGNNERSDGDINAQWVQEEFILDEWRKKGFSVNDGNPGMVVSFWEFLKRVCD